MGSECMSLPVIDFSNLKPATPEWENTKSEVVEHLREIGGFEAKFDEIPRPLGEAVLAGMKEMFDLPLDVKLRNKSNKPYRGYEKYTTYALLESLGIVDIQIPGNVEAFTRLLWPDGNPPFSENVLSMAEKLFKMDRMIRKMVVEALGLEKYMDDHMESAEYLLRFQKYDAPHTQEPQVGLLTHTDKSFISILYQNEVMGLDVQRKDGVWFSAEPSLNSCIVFLGDSYHAWTNGNLHSPHHRVMLVGDVDRYSIGLFSSPREGYTVKVPEELVDEDHPLLFKPYDLHRLVDEADWTHPDAFRKYCAIQTT